MYTLEPRGQGKSSRFYLELLRASQVCMFRLQLIFEIKLFFPSTRVLVHMWIFIIIYCLMIFTCYFYKFFYFTHTYIHTYIHH
jgi:hypothetical protein